MLEVKNLPSESEELHQMIFDLAVKNKGLSVKNKDLVVKNKDLVVKVKDLEQHKQELEEQVKLLKKNSMASLVRK